MENKMTFKEKAAIEAMKELLRHFNFENPDEDAEAVSFWAWWVAEHLDARRKEANEDGNA